MIKNRKLFATIKARQWRQREPHQTNEKITEKNKSCARALYKFLYISLSSSVKQEREMIKFFIVSARRTTANISYFRLLLKAVIALTEPLGTEQL